MFKFQIVAFNRVAVQSFKDHDKLSLQGQEVRS